jgi:excisionase family DNA binding protein
MPLMIEDIKLYSVKELSELLGVTKAAILSYIKTGRLKAQMLGGKWVIANDNLKEFLTGNYSKKQFSLEGIFNDGTITDEDPDNDDIYSYAENLAKQKNFSSLTEEDIEKIIHESRNIK